MIAKKTGPKSLRKTMKRAASSKKTRAAKRKARSKTKAQSIRR
jgi:hypothetical protein